MCACGVVRLSGENAGGGAVYPLCEYSAEPEAYFRIAPEDWLRAEMQGEIVALVHSHPGGLPWLSEADRRLQIKAHCPGGWSAGVTFTNSAVCHI